MPPSIRSVAILGAGIAGLACAQALTRAGLSVTLLDKGRRPGGRIATRHAEGTAFNHGAQFASARGAAFDALLQRLTADGHAAPWAAAGPGRIVFLPGMSALPALLTTAVQASGARLLTATHAAFLHDQDGGWQVRHHPAEAMRPGAVASTGGTLLDRHDAVLLAMPAPQAAALLAAIGHPHAKAAAGAVLAPCWAVMARFDAPFAVPPVLTGAHPDLPWAARETARPGRSDSGEAWTLHAGADWSRAHLEASADRVEEALLALFRRLTGAPLASWVRAHRWRHALVETPVGEPCLWDAGARIGACGDWLIGGRIEAAYDSGLALADRVLGG